MGSTSSNDGAMSPLAYDEFDISDAKSCVAFVKQQIELVLKPMVALSAKDTYDEDVAYHVELREKLENFEKWLSEDVELHKEISEVDELFRLLKIVKKAGWQHSTRIEKIFSRFGMDRAEGKEIELSSGAIDELQEAHTAAEDCEPNTNALTVPLLRPKQSSPEPSPPKPGPPQSMNPPDDSEIWGEGGVMFGLRVGSNNEYALRKDHPSFKKADTLGHNGNAIGAWWPYQRSLVFNGLHGHHQDGVHGNKAKGAFSVVLSNSSSTNSDFGDRIRYTIACSKKGGTEPATTKKTLLYRTWLQMSQAKNTDIRVIRGWKCSRYANFDPQGFRYDGLYKVVKYSPSITRDGHTFEEFELLRDPNQLPTLAQLNSGTPPIPTDAQKKQLEDAKKIGY